MVFPLMGSVFSCRGVDLFSLDLMSEGWYSGGSLINQSCINRELRRGGDTNANWNYVWHL